MWSTFYDIPPNNNDFPRTIPIGRSISNSRAFILDAAHKLVPPSVVGQLALGGDGVARGYTDTQLTRKSFVDILVAEEHHRVYLTGDRARWTSQGDIEFLGRLDYQVKLRGQRIELGEQILVTTIVKKTHPGCIGEIETVLRSNPTVQDAVTILHADKHGEKRLVAFVIPNSSSDAKPNQLIKHTASLLPNYMVPSVIQIVSTFPLTTATKVDRQALSQSFNDYTHERNIQTEGESLYISPRGFLEETISTLFQSVLPGALVGAVDE